MLHFITKSKFDTQMTPNANREQQKFDYFLLIVSNVSCCLKQRGGGCRGYRRFGLHNPHVFFLSYHYFLIDLTQPFLQAFIKLFAHLQQHFLRCVN